MSESFHPLAAAAERLSVIQEHALGQTLLERPRYGHFRPLDLPVAGWFELLDADVNNFQHNALTAELAYAVCTLDKASPELTHDMILTASIHDLPEDVTGTKSGDKQYNISSAADDRREHARLLELAEDADFPLTIEEVEQATAIMKDSKQKPPGTEAGWRFNIIERVGYLRTAMVAWDALNTAAMQPHHELHLMWMIGNVLGNHLEYLQAMRERSNAVDLQLTDCTPQLNAITFMLSDRRLQFDLWNLCKATGDSGNKLDPDQELTRIDRASTAWRKLVAMRHML